MEFCIVGARINAWEVIHRREVTNDLPIELASGHMRAIMGFQAEFDGHTKHCKQCAVAYDAALNARLRQKLNA